MTNFLDIIHRLSFIKDTTFRRLESCLRHQVKRTPTLLGPIDRASPYLRTRGEEYSSYSFLTSALGGGERSASRPDRALLPGKGPPVRIVQEAGWVPQSVWTQRIEEKFFRLCRGSNLDRLVVQPVSDTILPELTRLLI
jgi:hypothetical protein